MKRLFALFCVLVMALSMAACGTAEPADTSEARSAGDFAKETFTLNP